MGAVSGIPGDLTTSCAARMRSSVWPPSSYGNLPLVELGFVAVGDLPHIGEEYVELFLFGEDRGAVTADASAQDCYLFHDYRIFNVTRVMAASSSEMIQKRSTILVSNCPFFWK